MRAMLMHKWWNSMKICRLTCVTWGKLKMTRLSAMPKPASETYETNATKHWMNIQTQKTSLNAINVPVVKFHSSIWRQIWFDVIHFEWGLVVCLPSAILRKRRRLIIIINEHANNKWNVMSWRVPRNRCQSASVHCNLIHSALGAHTHTHICNYKM